MYYVKESSFTLILRPLRISSSFGPLVVPHIARVGIELTFNSFIVLISLSMTLICSMWFFYGLNCAKDTILLIDVTSPYYLPYFSSFSMEHGGYNFLIFLFPQSSCMWACVHEELACTLLLVMVNLTTL